LKQTNLLEKHGIRFALGLSIVNKVQAWSTVFFKYLKQAVKKPFLAAASQFSTDNSNYSHSFHFLIYFEYTLPATFWKLMRLGEEFLSRAKLGKGGSVHGKENNC
jgi:hypothetical protein